MMKKTGFTLAEVLITLSIIGVVAVMTLPALMTNVQEEQAKTGLKKGLNTLTEAAQMSQAIDGFDYSSVAATSTAEDSTEAQTIVGLLKNRTSWDVAKSGTTTTEATAVNNGSSNYVMFFRDGSALILNLDDTAVDQVTADPEADGLPKGLKAVYDVNGVKKPNLLSNCMGASGATLKSTGSDESDADACENKANRNIRDQFSIRLRGGYAQANGEAARWAYGK